MERLLNQRDTYSIKVDFWCDTKNGYRLRQVIKIMKKKEVIP